MTTHIQPATVLLRPRVTEKAALKADKANIYVFEVTKTATKKQIIASIKDAFKVTPIAVHLLAIPRKEVFRRGKSGIKGGGKKAYIELKKGDKIEVM
ncbi:MAG: 50S ribosomal protein L23 [Minisyncoccia bacterium]